MEDETLDRQDRQTGRTSKAIDVKPTASIVTPFSPAAAPAGIT